MRLASSLLTGRQNALVNDRLNLMEIAMGVFRSRSHPGTSGLEATATDGF